MGNVAKSIAKITVPIALASAVSGCSSFPKPIVDELSGTPVNLSMGDAMDKEQRQLIGDVLEGRVNATFAIKSAGMHADLMIQRLINGKNEERIDGISDWKGREAMWIVAPRMEAIIVRMQFTDPDEITFKNAYYLGYQLQQSLLPQISSRFGGWTSTCSDFMPIRTTHRSNMVRAIEMLCQRKIPTNDGKK